MPEMITAEAGEYGETALRLLTIAEELGLSPHVVKTTTDVSHSFIVPDEVAELYLNTVGASEEESKPAAKRGRPRKNSIED